MFRSWYAIGIGTGLVLVHSNSALALVHSNSANAQPNAQQNWASAQPNTQPNSANAQQQEIRHKHPRSSFHRQAANHRQTAANKEKDKESKTLTSLKMEIRDLRKQLVAVGSLRREVTELQAL